MSQFPKYIIAEFYDFKAERNVIVEAEAANKPIRLKGILQKANTQNRNGRVYPFEILKREADKYMEAVKERRALSELDHPECVDNDSLILTSNGWKNAKDINEEDLILTLNKQTNEIEIQKPTHITHKHYEGTMFNFKKRDIDLTVTPNHRFFLEDKKGNRFFKTATELYNEHESGINNGLKILKEGIWKGNDDEYFVLPGIPEIHSLKKLPHTLKERYSQDLKIKSETWFAFLGIYLAEGYCSGTNGYSKRKFKVGITQKKEETKNKIKNLLDDFPILFTEYVDKNGKSDFRTSDARLHNYLFKLGNSQQKHVPVEAKQASPYLLNILFEWFLMGDGKTGKTGRKTIFSTSEKMILDFQEILLKMGVSGSIHPQKKVDRKIIDKKIKTLVNEFGEETQEIIETERIIKAENSNAIYFLHFSTTKHIYIDNRFLQIKKVDYNNLVHCVTIPNEVFYVMKNGKSHWTGNSPIVSLSNCSHLITNMWWEGETLMGEVELLETEAGNKVKGLLKSGVMLGISSRGVGSVKNIKGMDVVQDDFELIAFDFVSSPSTPGAYMFKEGRQWGMTKLIGDAKKPEQNIQLFEKELKLINISKENYWNN